MPKEKLSPEEAYKEGRGVQVWAEGTARKRGSKHPAGEHYEAASQAIDSIRELDSEWADNLMESAAKAGQWQDAIGVDMYKKLTRLFQKAWSESLKSASKKEGFSGGEFSRNLALEDAERRINNRIATLFKGKENLLPIAKEIIKDFIDSNKDSDKELLKSADSMNNPDKPKYVN